MSVKGAHEYSPQALAMANKTYAEDKRITRDQNELDRIGATYDGEAAVRAAHLAEDTVARNQARQAELRAEGQKRYNMFQAKTEEAAAATVDPNKFWHEKGTGQKIGLVLGRFLAGFGGVGAGANYDKMVESAIDRDIAAQKANIDQKHKAAEGQLNMYKMFKDVGASDAEAELATRKAMYDNLTRQAEAFKSTLVDPTMRNQLDQKINEINKGQAKYEMGLQEATQGEVTKAYSRPVMPSGATPGTKFDRQYVGGVGYVEKGAYNEVSKQANYLAALKANNAKLRELYKQYDVGERVKNNLPLTDSPVKRQIDMLLSTNASIASQAFGSGTPQEAEYQRSVAAAGPGNVFSGNPTAGLDTLDGIVDNQIGALKQTHAAAEGTPEFGYNQKGQATETPVITGRMSRAPLNLKPIK